MANTEILEKILGNDLCAKWINLRDYAFDKLSANADIKAVMDEVDKYGYGEWVCEGQVPIMTSNTAPYGEMFAYNFDPSAPYYMLFDGSVAAGHHVGCPGGILSGYIGYRFTNPVVIKKINIYGLRSEGGTIFIDFQGSNDGTNYITLSSLIYAESKSWQSFDIDNNNQYLYYRMNCTKGTAASIAFWEAQFYAYQPKGNVPIMTSNTAPYGEASASGEYTTGYEAWRAFDNVDANFWHSPIGAAGQWIQYKFVNPICAKKVFLRLPFVNNGYYDYKNWTYKIQASNDGITYDDLTNETEQSAPTSAEELRQGYHIMLNNDNFYIYYRYVFITHNHRINDRTIVETLQFYGREMKVSVPTMISNTPPYGEVIASVPFYGYPAYHAFDNNDSTAYCADDVSSNGTYIGYKFLKPICVKRFKLRWFTGQNTTDTVIKIQASNDGSTWEDLSNQISLGSNTPNVNKDFETNIDNDNCYLYYRILCVSTSSGRYYTTALQFYGFDYSERDWDTDHPMRYLYDHGVELEEITLAGTATKEDHSLRLSAANAQASKSLDTTDYDLLRSHIGQHASGTNTLIAGSGVATITTVMMPYVAYLDISSVNGTNTTGVKQTATGVFDTEELWLE